MAWGDGSGFAQALDSRIIAPGEHAQELIDSYTYLTRMYTVISPNEMIADPIFHINPDLQDVPNFRSATEYNLCDGNSVVTLPDERIFEAVVWIMSHLKVVTEGAAASPVGALLQGLVKAAPGSKVVCVLSGGNVNLDQLRGLRWN